jgi:hypothetical protein
MSPTSYEETNINLNFTKKKSLMRKFIAVTVLVLLTILGNGQMMFNNIQLGVPYHNFKLELQKKGFTYQYNIEKEAENVFSYTGKFIDKDVNLGVLVTPKSKTVWKVMVELPGSDSWNIIKSEFFDLCEKMSKKYGLPYQRKTTFSKPYADGDGNELQAVFQDKCAYFYIWKTENGSVGIDLNSYVEGTALINIWYEDKNASTINSSENNKILMDGL